MTWHLITGRISGADEDSVFVTEAPNDSQALDDFVEFLTDGEVLNASDMDTIETPDGTPIYINVTATSETEIVLQ